MPLVIFLESTFHIHTCGWVIGVNHAWKEGKSVDNDGMTRVVIWDCFHSQSERLMAKGAFTGRTVSLDTAEQFTLLSCYQSEVSPEVR